MREIQTIYKLDEKDRIIREVVQDQPGVHLHEVSRKTGINKNTVWYRLKELERYGLVRLERGRQTLRCYPLKPISENQCTDGECCGGQ